LFLFAAATTFIHFAMAEQHKKLRATRKRGNVGAGLLPPANNPVTTGLVAESQPSVSQPTVSQPVAASLSAAAQVYVSSVYTLVPNHTQNLMSRLRQAACSSHHAWFLLGTAPLRLILLIFSE
jgi:hypothetical protein